MITLKTGREIADYSNPYIIAEIGANHNGDMELAKKLIFEAKEAGADCVKFQSWSKDSIFSQKVYKDNFFLKDDYRNRTDYTLEQIVDEFSISGEELIQMKKYADELGIDCASTPFSKDEVDFLVEYIKPPFIKIASMDLNNYPFLEYVAKKGLPVVMSTGLSTVAELDKAVRTVEAAGNKQIIILHCISLYPPKDEEVNLNNIDTLRTLYPQYPIGFSDHTLATTIPIASTMKGVCMIEKHFTLDKNLFGWDHKVSATPDELALICSESKRIVKALGTTQISVPENEERKNAFRRSIVITKNLPKGYKITEDDLDYKRPGSGIEPGEVKYVIGRVLAREIEADDILAWSDFV